MSTEEFSSRYQLLEEVAEGATTTYHALAHTGVVVMVHMLGGEEERCQAILARVEKLPRAPDGKVLEVTEREGRPVVVTKFILDFESFESWLDSADPTGTERGEFTQMFKRPDPSGDRPTEDDATEDDAPEAREEPGEFTRLFKRPDLPEPEDPSSASPPTASSPSRSDAPPPSGSDAAAASARDEEDPAPPKDPLPPREESSPSSTSEPGEFTRIFRGLEPGVDEGEKASGREESKGGDEHEREEELPESAPPDSPRFEADESKPAPRPEDPPEAGRSREDRPSQEDGPSQEVGRPPPYEPPEPPPRAPSPPLRETREEAEETGEFTREIRRRSDRSGGQSPPQRPRLGDASPPPDTDSLPPPSEERAGGGGDYRARLFDAADDADLGKPGDRGGQGEPRFDLPRERGPSDYTRVVSAREGPEAGPASPEAPPRSAPRPPTPEPATETPLWPFILGLVVVVLAAGAVVLYFALAGGTGT